MLRMGIDTFSFDRAGENYGVGLSVYVWHLLERLVDIGRAHTFFVFANRENEALVPRAPNVKVLVSPLPSRPRIFRPLHEQLFVPFYARRLRLDGVHFLGSNISYCNAGRSILTVYDLMWRYYMRRGSRNVKYRYFAFTVPWSLRRARALITISSFISDEIQSEFGIAGERITAIPLAPGTLQEADSVTRGAWKSKFDFPFIFSVTTSFPHKNLAMLIKGYALIRKSGAYNGKLVIAGQLKGPYVKEIQQTIQMSGVAEDISMLGFVSETLKTMLYQSADLVVYPSLYEGFGLPILEAMQCGIPVLCSRAASLSEVGGGACAYFDPLSMSDFVEKLRLVLHDHSLRKELVERGHKRVHDFTWDNTARATLQVYEKTFR